MNETSFFSAKENFVGPSPIKNVEEYQKQQESSGNAVGYFEALLGR